MNLISNLQIFGDSIMKGVLLDPETKKYTHISDEYMKRFEENFIIQTTNNSRFGCTVEKGYELIKNVLGKKHFDAILLEYGGNDCDFNWKEVSENPLKEYLPKTPIETFKEVYNNIITELKNNCITPIIMSLPPIDAEKYFNWITRNGLNKANIEKWLGDIQLIYRFQELYSNAAEKIAYERGCIFVDIRSCFLDKHNYKELLCDDGIHPNKSGHDLIFKELTGAALKLNLFPSR